MKTLVVGDIHGQYELVEKVLDLKMPTVFVGDFMDSFTRSTQDCVRSLMAALDASHNRDDVTVLFGNHERSYIDQHMVCSGYSNTTQSYISLLKPILEREMKHYTYAEGFLISHAGVSQRLLDGLDRTLPDYLGMGEFDQIGGYRGGVSPCGGLYWCDWNVEFEPLDQPQIVGHTRGEGVRQNGNSYCIDCLEDTNQSLVVIEDGKLEVLKLEDILWINR